MTDPKSKGIPDWQRGSQEVSDELKVIEPKSIDEIQTPAEGDLTSRAELVAQAGSWLEHPHIRDAPIEGKISFLEGKGLTKIEIDDLLGSKEKSNLASAKEQSGNVPEDEAPAWDEVTPPETTTPAEHDTDSSTPPIITYPEFLLKPPAKPPLVSRTALLRTIYGTAITAGALHLTSKYLIEPMVAELSDSRHQLFEKTTTNLDNLNEKLGSLVSVSPSKAHINKYRTIYTDPVLHEVESDTSSEASDPSELFHRDVGVQTSRPSSPTSSSEQDTVSAGGKIASQSAKLQALRSHLSDLHASGEDSTAATDSVADEVSRLEAFLDDLKYARRVTMQRSWEAALPSGVSYTGGLKKDKDEDEIDRIKAEIKGVKGVLLSAKSFPTGARPGRSR